MLGAGAPSKEWTRVNLFSAGMDLAEVGNGVGDMEVDDEIRKTTELIGALAIPTLAAVEGRCIGAAVEIALACDLRVVGGGADFSIPAARLGILYRPDAVASLVKVAGRATAMRLLVFCERIDAAEAAVRGLATHVVADGTALTAALALCAGLARDTTEAVRATRRLIAQLGKADDDVSSWEDERRRLLASDARTQALARARPGTSRFDPDAPSDNVGGDR